MELKDVSVYFIPNHIEKHICIDVGSNIGSFTLKHGEKFSKVLCFEACYKNYTMCRKNTEHMNHVTHYNLAVSHTSGQIVHIHEHSSGDHGSRSTIGGLEWGSPAQPVLTISLEDIFKIAQSKKINYMKVDIECAEYDFLMNKDLSSIDCISIELHCQLGTKRQELMDYLDKYFTIVQKIEHDHYEITYLNKRFYQKVLFVTAFKDIGRGTWGRPKEEYIQWFQNLQKAVEPLVCFSDVVDGAFPYKEDETFFNLIERDRECMESEEYKTTVPPDLLQFPEHCRPEYTSVTHTKVNFVARAARMFPGYTHYAWIDFGYIRSEKDIPTQWKLEPILDSKIHFASYATMPDVTTPQEMCATRAPNFIQGGMFIVPKHLTDWLELEYRHSLDAFYREKCANDEQIIFLHVYMRNPEHFQFHRIDEWFGLMKLFSLKT